MDRETQLVIEGFPRSGNTFAVYAFEQAQRRKVSVAHHLHAPAQVIRATNWRIPCLVLIRNPMDAVLSLVIREPRISLPQAFRHYISFYETVAACDGDGYVLGPFEELVSDYGAVLERVNERFGTWFRPFEHTEENVKAIFASIESAHRAKRNKVVEEKIARPSSAKEERKAALREELKDDGVSALAERAESAYGRLISP